MDLGPLLEESGAVLHGHFILTSGRHSSVYFENFRILEQPQVLSALCKEIAEHFEKEDIDAVAGPLTGGIIIAFEVARLMNKPAIYVESEDGVKTLRRGKTLEPGSKVLIVDDILTTGRSIYETRDAIERAGGVAAGYGVLVNRAQNWVSFDIPVYSAYHVEAESFAPEEVPDWLAAIPAIKPGTRA